MNRKLKPKANLIIEFGLIQIYYDII